MISYHGVTVLSSPESAKAATAPCAAHKRLTDLGLTDLQTTTKLASLILGLICLLNVMVPGTSEVRLAHNDCQNLKLAWEDVRNHGRMELSVNLMPCQV